MIAPTLSHVLRFGVFELDTDSGELRRHGLKIRLPDQSFQILKELLSRPEVKKRIHELERRRAELLPSFRVLLDQVSSADSGVSPTAK